MTMMKTPEKYVLSKRIDSLVDKRINQDFRRRLSKDEWGDVKDGWLKKILDPKEQEGYYDLDRRITEQDLKNEIRSLYFECLLDFLKSEDIKLIGPFRGIRVCSFKGQPAILHNRQTARYGRYYSNTWVMIVAKDDAVASAALEKENKHLRLRYITIYPWIEEKLEKIADFVILKRRLIPMFEASKAVRNKKTIEERTHVDKNGRKVIGCDTYNLVKCLGEEWGSVLNGAEKSVRTNFKLTVEVEE